MKTLDIHSPGITLPDSVTQMGEEPLALLEKGRPVAVLLPVGNSDLETISLSLNPKFQKILHESEKSYYLEGGMSHEEVCQLFGVKPAAANGVTEKKTRKKRAPRD